MAWDSGRRRRRCARSVGRALAGRLCVCDTFQSETRRLFLVPADADAVTAAATLAPLSQTFGRARTVVDGQPLGLPG